MCSPGCPLPPHAGIRPTPPSAMPGPEEILKAACSVSQKGNLTWYDWPGRKEGIVKRDLCPSSVRLLKQWTPGNGDFSGVSY